jgi:hypothetical protein
MSLASSLHGFLSRATLAAPDGYHTLPLPDRPTEAAPGSEEKIAIMAERAAAGRSCFHPKDAVGRSAIDGELRQRIGLHAPAAVQVLDHSPAPAVEGRGSAADAGNGRPGRLARGRKWRPAARR